jgi:hypothetical protein
MDPKSLPKTEADHGLEALRQVRDRRIGNIERYEFIRNCTNEHQLDAISNVLGDPDALDELIDALITEAA